MRSLDSSRGSGTAAALVLVLLAAASVPSTAQTSDTRRTSNGRPDLSGNYDAGTLTPLVRPAELGDRLELTEEEADAIARRMAAIYASDQVPSDPDREAPPVGGTLSFHTDIARALGETGTGGYNGFYMDQGDRSLKIDGKYRTSILVDPSNGQLPEMTGVARARLAERGTSRRPNTGTAWWIDDEIGPYDDMETRPNAERCITGFTGAAPTFPSLYNNYKSIVQTEDHVVILIEMNHDARVVRMNSEHLPTSQRKWLGDSIGWWEGDTLVVETTHFRPDSRQGRGATENLHLTERFSRQASGDVLYRFTVEDPTVWTAPWTGEYVWRATGDNVYEYSCHEGNYAMGNIMRGARLLEQEALARRGGESGRE